MSDARFIAETGFQLLRKAVIQLVVPALFLLQLPAFASSPDEGETPPIEVRLSQPWRWRILEGPGGVRARICIDHWNAPGLVCFFEGNRIARFDGISWIEEVGQAWKARAGTGLSSVFQLDDGICGLSLISFNSRDSGGRERSFDFQDRVTHPAFLPDGTVVIGHRGRIMKVTLEGLVPLLAVPRGVERLDALLCDDPGNLWCTTDQGFFHRRGSDWEALPLPRSCNQKIPHTRIVSCGKWIWFLPDRFTPGYNGLIWDGERISTIHTNPEVFNVRDALALPGGILALATTHSGLHLYHTSAWHRVALPDFLDEYIASLSLVKTGKQGSMRLVMTTDSGTLAHCDITTSRWREYSPPAGSICRRFNTIAPSRKGGFWVGSNTGIARFNGEAYVDIHVKGGDIPLKTITALHEDDQGQVWVGSGAGSFGGVLRFDGTTWHRHLEPEGVQDSPVHAIRSGRDGSLWFLLLNDLRGPDLPGAVRLSPDGKWTRFTTRDGLPSNRCYDLITTPDHTMYMATFKGVVRFRDGRWHPILDASKRPMNRSIFSLLATRDGTLWAGENLFIPGVLRFQGGKWEQMSGPSWRHVAAGSMCEDAAGRIWFASMRGLFMFDGRHCNPVSKEPGTSQKSFWPVLTDGQGILWIGSYHKGLVQYVHDDNQAPVCLDFHTLIHLDGKGATVRWKGRDPWDVTPMSGLRFKHRVDGGPWSAPVSLRHLDLGNLSLEDHTVTVQAVDLAGNYEIEPRSIEFTIPVPFWKRPIHFLLATLIPILSILIVVVIFRRREKQRAAQQDRAALQESERRFRTLVEESDFILRRFGPDGEPLYTSPQMESLTGYSAEEIHRDPDLIFRTIHPEDLEAAMSLRKARSRQSTRRMEAVFRFRHRDGSWRWMFVMQRPRLTGDGHLEGYDILAVDRTEKKSLEEDLENARNALQQAHKLESLGILASGIAHDFNNLLVGVLGYAGLARQDLEPGSRTDNCLQEVEKASSRAADLCRQLLAYSGRGKFVVRPVNLTDLIQEMHHLLEVAVSEKTSLETDLQNPLPLVLGDPAQLNQVIMNLVINASEAIGADVGRIRLKTGAVEVDRTVLKDALLGRESREGPFVCVQIEDSGGRLDMDHLDRIFDPFYTTKKTGHGLGLAVVQGIVRGHNGILKVSSIPGQSSTFQLLFPATTEADQVKKKEKEEDAGDAWRDTGTILVVDDNPMVASVARDTLQAVGFKVVSAEDGVAGVEAYRKHTLDIQAVLLDMNMPRMGGEEVLKELRSIRSDLPILLSSGFDEGEASIRHTNNPSTAFIQKPYSPSRLLDTLQDILYGARTKSAE